MIDASIVLLFFKSLVILSVILAVTYLMIIDTVMETSRANRLRRFLTHKSIGLLLNTCEKSLMYIRIAVVAAGTISLMLLCGSIYILLHI